MGGKGDFDELLKKAANEYVKSTRFEMLENIFEQHGFSVNGKEFWNEIEREVSESGNDSIEFDDLFLEGQKYRCFFDLAVINGHDEEQDTYYTDIHIKSISVTRPDGKQDKHTFVYDF